MNTNPLHILYVFPEPLPLNRARGVQVAHFVNALAEEGAKVTLAYVPATMGHPFSPLGIDVPQGVTLLPLSRQLPVDWPLSVKSHRLFMWRLARWFGGDSGGLRRRLVFFRHIKLRPLCSMSFPTCRWPTRRTRFSRRQQPKRISPSKRGLSHAALIISIEAHARVGKCMAAFWCSARIRGPAKCASLSADARHKDWKLPAGDHLCGKLVRVERRGRPRCCVQWLPGFRITLSGGDEKGVSRLESKIPPGHVAGRLLPIDRLLARLGRGIEGSSISDSSCWWCSSCIAVLPNRAGSVSEFTSPLKLFEYMASGCAIVVSDLPVLREILAEDEAAWFQPGDPKGLADAIRRTCWRSGARQEHGRTIGRSGKGIFLAGKGREAASNCYGRDRKFP